MLKKIAASLTSILFRLLLQIVKITAALALDAGVQLAFQPHTAGHQQAKAEECTGSLRHDGDLGNAFRMIWKPSQVPLPRISRMEAIRVAVRV